MEPNEAKNLLILMGSRDVLVLEKVLVTVSNLATFTPNQVRSSFSILKLSFTHEKKKLIWDFCLLEQTTQCVSIL